MKDEHIRNSFADQANNPVYDYSVKYLLELIPGYERYRRQFTTMFLSKCETEVSKYNSCLGFNWFWLKKVQEP